MTGLVAFLGTALDKAATLQAGALAALFLIAMFTEVGVPFPFVLDTTFLFVGYRAGFFSWQMAVLLLVLFLGGLAGASSVYLVSRLFSKRIEPRLDKRFAGLRSHARRLTEAISGKRAPLAVAIGRLTPGLLIPVSVASGLARLPFSRFALGLALASVVIDAILISIGLATRSVVNSRLIGMPPALIAFGAAILISLAWALPRLLGRLRKRKTVVSPGI